MLDEGCQGSGCSGSYGISPRWVGQCPVVNVVVDGVVVPKFRLKAANGLDIPYCGYVELDVEVLGKLLPCLAILVVKDSGDALTQQKKGLVPGVLGMNVLVSCYRELFSQHGDQLFQSSVLQAAAPGWRSALSECQTLEYVSSSSHIGSAVTPRGPAVQIPAGTLKLVPATCRQDLASCVRAVLMEASGQGEDLPPGLLVPSVLLPVEKGSLVFPVVNVGHKDQWLKPRVTLGQLSMASMCPAQYPISFTEQEDSQNPIAYIQSVGVQSTSLVGLGEVSWPNLKLEEQQEAKALLEQYATVFSHETGDLRCTTLVEHEIPLLDDVPVRQRYRRLPPSQYDLVKAHIQELVECGIAKTSCSPYSSPVVVQKKDCSIRLCVDYRQLNAKTRKDAFPLPRIEESLDALTKLVTAPVLGYADFSKPFVLEVDASSLGLGPVLSQECAEGRRPIAYTAKLGVVEQRWAAQLALFDFKVLYRAGATNKNADALSWLPLPPSPSSIDEVAGGVAVPRECQALRVTVASMEPVDADPTRNSLLGGELESVEVEELGDWAQEHRERLAGVFSHAEKQLKAAAAYRARHTHPLPIVLPELNIHRSELRPLPATSVEPERRLPVDICVRPRSVAVDPMEDVQVVEELPEVLVIPRAALPQETEVRSAQAPLGLSDVVVLEAPRGLSGIDSVGEGVLFDLPTVPSEVRGQLAREVAPVVELTSKPVRRSHRGTAGQHTNLFHLPRSVVRQNNGQEVEATARLAVVSAQTLFRPWQ
ncbi:hypothetical protein SRHO_G00131020 [Serrasalmus rhombeus]